tara:strand:+ start:1126 stop:1350 length:225 start_codon:yes stop_codon:yes gene_type:complete
MKLTYNLSTGQELHFSVDTTPTWRVAYGYCQDNNLLSWLYGTRNNLEAITNKLDIKQSISGMTLSCGDWATING